MISTRRRPNTKPGVAPPVSLARQREYERDERSRRRVRTVSVTFPANDTWVRATVTQRRVASTSKVLVGVRAPTTTSDLDDPGWAYSAQVVRTGTGTFDVVVHAIPLWEADVQPEGPGTTVIVTYVIG